MALRNTLGVALPLMVGAWTDAMAPAIAVTIGALNVSFSDTNEPYIIRARRMIAASVLVGIAVAAGGVLGEHRVLSVILLGAWAFGAGMLVALGSTAADLGTISLVTVCVYAGTGRPVEQALMGGLLAFGGGLLQTAITLALWPLRRHGPERELLAGLMTDLQHMAQAEHMEAADSPPATGAISGAQQSLSALNDSNTIEAERLVRSSPRPSEFASALLRCAGCDRAYAENLSAADAAELLDEAFRTSATALGAVAATLSNGTGANKAAPPIGLLDELASRLRHSGDGNSDVRALIADARTQVQALTGRLRAASDLAAGMTAAGAVEFDRTESRRSPALRLTGTLATIRANLHLTSTTFRHAVRLAVCVAAATALGREIGFQRAYWMPMTAAIVLKPDFTATFTRGILRIGGTFLGLLAATGFFTSYPQARAPTLRSQSR